MKISISRLWNKIINVGITSDLVINETKYIRVTNGICFIAVLWLLPLSLFFIPLLPDSKNVLFNCIFFPTVWLGTFVFNYFRYYLIARVFLYGSAIICVTLNAFQLGRDSENHLYLITAAIASFYIFPKTQFKYIVLISISSLLAFIAVEFYSTDKGAFINAPPEFFKFGRLISMIGLAIIIFALTAYHYRSLNKAQEEIEEAHKKSENLLLNILPPSIASKLKNDNASTIAERIDGATILFADIVGFTRLSQNIEPEKLVELLNDLFSEFDNITRKFGLEKIKTIGDAYMVAGGVPERNDHHCELIARCGLEMLEIMNKGAGFFSNCKIRIGIHTGPVVAGVIGNSKFAYDLWGDSVNTASRMESHSEANKIMVTRDVFLKLKDKFIFEEGRTIHVKGKGNMETYFLNSVKES
jgi:adenylate cyclase